VYHVAAFVSLRAGDRQQVFDVNVLGTRRVLEAAERAGVHRVVYCSSFGAVGQNPAGASDESWTVNPFDTHLDYELSKAMSELEVHRAVQRGLDVVIVNPCGIVGPHDYRPSSVGQTILDFANRKMPVYVPGQFDFVAMRDVVDGHLLAMEKGRRGERYILSGGLFTLDQILDHLSRLTGVRKPRLKLPPQVMLPIAHVSSAIQRAFFPSVPPRFTPGTIKLLGCGKRADASKARRELGLEPTSVLEAFTESVEWFRSRGQIPLG
jgi:nucleoside-diphosphate-sugar epimerase